MFLHDGYVGAMPLKFVAERALPIQDRLADPACGFTVREAIGVNDQGELKLISHILLEDTASHTEREPGRCGQ